MKVRPAIMLCCLMFFVTKDVGAQLLQQLQYNIYLQMAAAKVNQPVLSYRYKVVFVNNTDRKMLDSTSGVLCKYYGSFLDSNSLAISLMSDGYFFKADHRKNTALLCNVASVQKKLAFDTKDINNKLFELPDSLLAKIADLKTEETGDALILTYVFRKGSGSLREIVFSINKKDGSMIELRMTVDESDKWGSPTGYSKVFQINGFTNNISKESLKLGNYVSLEQDKVRLKGKLQHYTLNKFL